MSSNEYLIVFDTNILYVPYKDRADFTTFYFNSTFKNVIDKIEELDLYDYIKVGVPTVVWQEMITQKYEAYNLKLQEIKQKTDKFEFPFHKFIQEKEEIDYRDFLIEKLNHYREILCKRLVKITDIDLPSNDRFASIVKRAFEKRPPFEGTEGTSDKGFKDALLWESILEYKVVNKDINIILYSNDKLFCDELIHEFKNECENSDILIFGKNHESELIKELETIALKIDRYSFIEDTDDDVDHVRIWINSDDFRDKILRFQHKLEEVNKYTKLSEVSVEEIYDIEEFETDDKILKDIRISLSINFWFKILDKAETREKYDVTVYANVIDGMIFVIDDIEIEQGGDEVE
ncbi:MAG: PIN domain-containing protein [Vulcanibacillus sp.]